MVGDLWCGEGITGGEGMVQARLNSCPAGHSGAASQAWLHGSFLLQLGLLNTLPPPRRKKT